MRAHSIVANSAFVRNLSARASGNWNAMFHWTEQWNNKTRAFPLADLLITIYLSKIFVRKPKKKKKHCNLFKQTMCRTQEIKKQRAFKRINTIYNLFIYLICVSLFTHSCERGGERERECGKKLWKFITHIHFDRFFFAVPSPTSERWWLI